jgi:three-Cys-motif partner protein
MGKLVDGDDGLPAEEVGEWITDKHDLLCRYVPSATRKKYLPPHGNGGACYIDLFCGPGRAKVKNSGQFVDGGCVAAWRQSVSSGAPFSRMVLGDTDQVRLGAAAARLERAGAPVVTLLGSAKDNAFPAIRSAGNLGLHFAFLDPYNLETLDFSVISTLARLRRIDMLVHVSQMDLQRNFDRNASLDASALDTFAPGWREKVDIAAARRSSRQAYFEYWKTQVDGTGADTNTEIRLITGPGNQPLYLLLLAARHELAHKFWETVAQKDDGQGRLV